ncbi:MAG: phosphatidate cytidylyltransferase, partial [Pseudomonadota bacterium]|nr:phosphatidate cytidylyltransferase [Pseudomonadota bacterium]
LVDLHAERPELLLYLLVLIWLADSAAYFSGKKLGRTRLAPALSPGKSREGVFGALAATLLLGLAGAWWFDAGLVDGVYFVILSLLTALVSVEGDLFESLLKRRAGVKDSGRILPGHGGVLDRIDSLTAAAPVFWMGLYWIRVPLAA